MKTKMIEKPKVNLDELTDIYREFYLRNGRLPKTKFEAVNAYYKRRPQFFENVRALRLK